MNQIKHQSLISRETPRGLCQGKTITNTSRLLEWKRTVNFSGKGSLKTLRVNLSQIRWSAYRLHCLFLLCTVLKELQYFLIFVGSPTISISVFLYYRLSSYNAYIFSFNIFVLGEGGGRHSFLLTSNFVECQVSLLYCPFCEEIRLILSLAVGTKLSSKTEVTEKFRNVIKC